MLWSTSSSLKAEFISAKRCQAIQPKPGNQVLATRILESLPKGDRDVICRLYVDRQSAEDIERDLGLPAGYVRGLKRSVKARFFDGAGASS